jgi:effector-binding domain-containing protein
MSDATVIRKERTEFFVGLFVVVGSLIMGIIGDQKRMDAATISDTVNTASRMEGLTKFYGTRILLSEYSLEMLEHKSTFNFRHLGKVQVKGKKIFTDIYECIDGDTATSFEYKKQTLEVFEQGLLAYFQKSFDQTIDDLKRIIKSKGLVKDDDLVINIASMPMKEKGRTNMMKLSYIS